MSLSLPYRWVSLGGFGATDPDAIDYIRRVTAADGQALELPVQRAIDQFFRGSKSDGYWNAIKACCILAGARTLSGALTPLVGAAPTNFNFVSGDYDRKTGLVGNASTKRLDSNRNNNADPQDSQHFALFASTAVVDASRYMGSGNNSGSSTLGLATNNFGFRSRNSANVDTLTAMANGFMGKSRNNGLSVNWRVGGISGSTNQTSNTPSNETIEVFRGAAAPTASRFAFYSIGESLNLALLDARVTTLINAIAAAIP